MPWEFNSTVYGIVTYQHPSQHHYLLLATMLVSSYRYSPDPKIWFHSNTIEVTAITLSPSSTFLFLKTIDISQRRFSNIWDRFQNDLKLDLKRFDEIYRKPVRLSLLLATLNSCSLSDEYIYIYIDMSVTLSLSSSGPIADIHSYIQGS